MKRLPYVISYALLCMLLGALWPFLGLIWLLGGHDPFGGFCKFIDSVMDGDSQEDLYTKGLRDGYNKAIQGD